MRALHICARFSPVSETFIYDYIRTMPSLGVETAVVTSRRENADLFPLEHVLEVPDLKELSLGRLWSKLRGRTKPRAWPRTRMRAVEHAVSQWRPDLLHAHFGHVGASSLALARSLKVPLVVSFHGRDAFQFPRDPRWRGLYSRMFESGARFTAVSEYMRNELAALRCPAEAMSIVHVGIDPGLFRFREPRRDAGAVRFVSVGRMVEKKGFADCVRAFHLAQGQGANIELSIIGDGPERETVQHLAASLGLGSPVSFLGQLPRPQVVEAMASADAFVLASRTAADGDKEGIPTVLMEAEFIGLPIVSTTHSGIPEAIPEPSRRFLAREADPDDLATKILDLCGQAQSWPEIAELGRKHVDANFNLATETEKLIDVYRAALG
jgi:colanic acid/amylovoran biosynthesis glycosyltransferase